MSNVSVARAFLYLAESRVDKRHRRMVKWVDLTAAQFLAAHIDNNGSIRLIVLIMDFYLMF